MLYLHIPFCKQKCSYCNFHFSTSFSLKDEMLQAILKEIEIRHHELEYRTLKSIYFGGGTPSVLGADELARLVEKLSKYFEIPSDTEFTLEANPDDLNAAYLKALNALGINRLSLGIQSFYYEDLRLMNRAHSAREAEAAIKRSQDAGLCNISIDLIYGSQSSGFDVWRQNLEKAVSFGVPHISAYALTVEPKTALNAWIASGKVPPPDDRLQSESFQYMCRYLKASGFEHYEISNFGKPGCHSRHNSAYWAYQPYLGIGPSAHSYNGKAVRSWNVANNSQYIKCLNQGKTALESEYLSDKDRFNEMLMIGLRTAKGVDLNKIRTEFSRGMVSHLLREIQPKIDKKLLVLQDHALKIPEEHWFLADGIAADLFMV